MFPFSQNDAIQYKVLKKASTKQRDVLVDSRGYSYTVKQEFVSSRSWRCVVRNKKTCCSATVVEEENGFRSGPSDHNHAPEPAAASKRRIIDKVWTIKEFGLEIGEGFFENHTNVNELRFIH
jgi:hypothetical protein